MIKLQQTQILNSLLYVSCHGEVLPVTHAARYFLLIKMKIVIISTYFLEHRLRILVIENKTKVINLVKIRKWQNVQ